MKFNKVKVIFLSNVHPDYFAGFPGFFLSAKESAGMELKNYRLGIMGPKGLQELISMGKMFYAGLQNLSIFEYGKMS